MSADALIARLSGVKRTSRDRWVARCPSHEDRRASLAIRELPDGRTLVHCFAGCETEAVLEAAGVGFESLFPPKSIAHARQEQRPWRVKDLVAALEFELTLTLVILSSVEQGREIKDRTRAGEAKARIVRFLWELQHAR